MKLLVALFALFVLDANNVLNTRSVRGVFLLEGILDTEGRLLLFSRLFFGCDDVLVDATAARSALELHVGVILVVCYVFSR